MLGKVLGQQLSMTSEIFDLDHRTRSCRLRLAGLMMKGLRKQGEVDFRQGSTDQLFPWDLRDWLLQNNLLLTELKSPRAGIRDFKKQNHR